MDATAERAIQRSYGCHSGNRRRSNRINSGDPVYAAGYRSARQRWSATSGRAGPNRVWASIPALPTRVEDDALHHSGGPRAWPPMKVPIFYRRLMVDDESGFRSERRR